MPELPEVQTIVSTLRGAVVGRRITDVALRRADILTPPAVDLPARLLGRTITAIDRRGKRIVFTLDDQNRFYVHLGMSGRLTIAVGDDALPKHTHLIVGLDAAAQARRGNGASTAPALRFSDPRRFGGIWWLGAEAAHDAGLGPEPLFLRADELAMRLARTRRAIKNALLDQRLIAGLGNIYVDEALFAAGIHPLAAANRLSGEQVSRLCRSIKTVLRRAIRHRGSTLRDYVDADGKAGEFQKVHRVYGREGLPCPRCRTPIGRVVLGGRSTHYCPCCQAV